MSLRKQKRRPGGDVADEANPQTVLVERFGHLFKSMKMQTLTKTIRIYIMIQINPERVRLNSVRRRRRCVVRRQRREWRRRLSMGEILPERRRGGVDQAVAAVPVASVLAGRGPAN